MTFFVAGTKTLSSVDVGNPLPANTTNMIIAHHQISLAGIEAVGRFLGLTLLLLVTGCADPIENAKQKVRGYAVNKHDVVYRGLEAYSGDVVCGEFDSFTAWGESNGYKRFIVYKDNVLASPSSEDWAIFCTEKSAEALLATYGIGPFSAENTDLEKIHKDLKYLDTALNLYLDNFGIYPPHGNDANLRKLLDRKPGEENKDAGYLSALPTDPWGNDYHYVKLRTLHGSPQMYKLYTLGKDGIVGGTGENADVSNEHVKYLDHIKGL